jgi:TonB family protein
MRTFLCLILSSAIVISSGMADQTYAPPAVTSAGDAYIPYENQIITDGLFVLDVGISDAGEIQQIEALRNPGSMVEAAKRSLRSWKFQPASENGKPTASRLTVAFLQPPTVYIGVRPVPPKDFVPVIPPDQSGSGFIPVGILSFDYSDYPVNSVAWGSVVLRVTVGSAGDVKNVSLLHSMPGFNDFALHALKRWRFRAATFQGKTVTSDTVVAFIFQTPRSRSSR